MGIWEETKLLLHFFSQSIMIWYGTPRSGKLCLNKAGKDLKTILEGLGGCMEDGTEEVEDMFGTVISGTSSHSWGDNSSGFGTLEILASYTTKLIL